jgi:hypothetical protein
VKLLVKQPRRDPRREEETVVKAEGERVESKIEAKS